MIKWQKAGFGGLTNNVPDAYTPGSDVANMSIFGFNPANYYTGRGPLEAGSMGIETTDKDVIFRCNTITQKDNHMDDFNAGHITSGEAEILMDSLNDYFNEKYDDFKKADSIQESVTDICLYIPVTVLKMLSYWLV